MKCNSGVKHSSKLFSDAIKNGPLGSGGLASLNLINSLSRSKQSTCEEINALSRGSALSFRCTVVRASTYLEGQRHYGRGGAGLPLPERGHGFY